MCSSYGLPKLAHIIFSDAKFKVQSKTQSCSKRVVTQTGWEAPRIGVLYLILSEMCSFYGHSYIANGEAGRILSKILGKQTLKFDKSKSF